jgi:hypothetical protein
MAIHQVGRCKIVEDLALDSMRKRRIEEGRHLDLEDAAVVSEIGAIQSCLGIHQR